MAVTTQDWHEWSHHPVTQAYLQALRGNKQETMETWARGGYVGESAEHMTLKTSAALGRVEVIDHLISNIEDMMVAPDAAEEQMR